MSLCGIADASRPVTTLNTINNNSLTINESSGTLGTFNGVTYRVFNVTSYSQNNAGIVTINGLAVSNIYSNYRGMVQFTYSQRADVTNDLALNGVSVYDATCDRTGNPTTTLSTLTPVHRYYFSYLFSTANNTYKGVAGSFVSQRMFLDEYQADDKVYSFLYNNLDALPPRLSFSQD